MAFNRRTINPLDLQPRKAVGISLPFSGKAVFNSTYQTKDAVKTNIINYFLTGVGERYLNPSFGTRVRNLLFENIEQGLLTNLQAEIRRGLSLYFPRVITNTVEIIPSPDINTVTLFIKYSIKDTNIEDELAINFEQ